MKRLDSSAKEFLIFWAVLIFAAMCLQWGYKLGEKDAGAKVSEIMAEKTKVHKELAQCQSELATFQAIVKQMVEGGRDAKD